MADLLAQTNQGPARGFRDGLASAWLGLPYAAPPVATRRFRAPAPPLPWSGLREATQFGPAALQPLPGPMDAFARRGLRFGEDCLSLNVWSPGIKGCRPVMVWVHGGGFVRGSGALYRGGPLATLGDIVVVSLNYRLGVFGFVNIGEAIGDRTIESNLGLRDIVAALRWVRDNIAGFGGDPTRVTLAGESAGAVATALLMLSDEAAPLFHQAIQQNGPIEVAQSRDTSLRTAQRYTDHLGPEAGTLAALQRLPAPRLIAAAAAASKRIAGVSPTAPWFDGDLLPANLEAARSKPPRRIPLLAGFNRGNGAGPFRKAPPDAWATGCIAMSMLHAVERHATSGAPTWLYRFDYAHPLLGTTSALDLLFLWPCPGLRAAAARGGFLTGLRSGLSERMRSAWTTFVRMGAPGDDWPRFTPPERQTRLFALQDRVVADPLCRQRLASAGQDSRNSARSTD